MSGRFTAWLRVNPRVKTLAESSAIYQALSKQGRINVFIKATRPGHVLVNDKDADKPCSLYYTVFPHEPPTLQMTFDVPVYHGLASARDEDPFNIRGLQDRKPMPPPKMFKCKIEKVDQTEAGQQDEKIVRENPFHGNFVTAKNSPLQEVLIETGAPPGTEKGLSAGLRDLDRTDSSQLQQTDHQSPKPGRGSKINMGSLMQMWRQGTSPD